MARFENLNVNKINATKITQSGVDIVSDKHEFVDGGTFTTAGGDTTELVATNLPGGGTEYCLACYNTTNDTDNMSPVRVARTAPQVVTTVVATDPSTAHNVTYAVARDRGKPMLKVFAAGTFTTAGGDATESITVTGATAGDLAIVQVNTVGSTPRVLCAAACTTNAITVTLAGDPSTDHVLNYMVLRPVGNWTPSHTIFAAGSHTTVGGAAAEPISIAGLSTSDVCFACYNTTDDTDTILTVKPTAAGTLTVTGSADPADAHAITYVVLRAV